MSEKKEVKHKCTECGADMYMDKEDNEFYQCVSCDFYIHEEYFRNIDDEYDDYYNDEDDETPEGCVACGGPYPNCMSSCNMFDD